MKIKVKLFAIARQTLGDSSVDVELAEGATLGTLREHLKAEYPELANIAGRSMFAVDTRYIKDDQPLQDQAEVAWIPPVSGG